MDSMDSKEDNVWSKSLSATRGSLEYNTTVVEKLFNCLKRHSSPLILGVVLVAFHGFLIAAGTHNFQKAAPLIYVTIFLWACVFLNFLTQTKPFQTGYAAISEKVIKFAEQKRFVPISLKIAFAGALLAFTIVSSLTKLSRLTGFAGYVFFIIAMVVLSNSPRKINWSVVSSALIFHYCLALIILQWSTGRWFFEKVSQLIVGLLEFAQVGAKFVFGFIADPPNICDLSSVFIFTSLQTLIYFAAVVAILFHFGLIQMILKKSTWFMKVLIGTTPVESVYCWACAFLGMTEAPCVIRPYLESMTDSELFAVLTSGFSCTGGTVFAAYVALGACPESILTASLLSAPLSLACSKIMFPEEEETRIKEEDFNLDHENSKGFFDTLCSAGAALVPTVFAIGATLVVVMSLLALLDEVFFYIGDLIGYDGWSFQMLFGYAFFPLAYIMGITDSSEQTLLVAQLMGSKTAVNEFVAYDKLGQLQKLNKLHPKSVLVATYALCGFSNFGSMGIQMEVIGGMAPGKKTVVSGMMLRALCAGAISCFLNATVAGILISDPAICIDSNANSTCFSIPS